MNPLRNRVMPFLLDEYRGTRTDCNAGANMIAKPPILIDGVEQSGE
jgi:hypothetical protein